jgi:hypothetical protein
MLQSLRWGLGGPELARAVQAELRDGGESSTLGGQLPELDEAHAIDDVLALFHDGVH